EELPALSGGRTALENGRTPSDVVERDPGDPGQAEEAGTHVEEDGLTGPERWIDGRQKHALYLAGSPDRPERDPPQRNATEVEAITRDLRSEERRVGKECTYRGGRQRVEIHSD